MMATIFTIGYEGTDIDRFVATLRAVGIERIADVRAVALSRKKGFSKKSLAARLDAEGIDYIHFGDLGDPKPGRDAAKAGQYKRFHAIYSKYLSSEDAQASLRELLDVAGEKPTCLMCFERDPVTCHRAIVAEEMTEFGFEVLNLYGDDPARYAGNAHRIPRHHSRQGAAAA
jgi:uncharacterized protein (DUF488 family)